MIKSGIVAAILMMALVPSLASATPAEPGAYVGGGLGVSVPRDSPATGTDYFQSPNSNFRDKVSFDPGVYVSGNGGYDFGWVRLEGELAYRYNEIKSIIGQNGRVGNPDGNLGVFSVLFNGFVDLHNDTPVTPYFGGGIGFATLHLDATHGRDNLGRYLVYGEGDDTVFAYQAGAGVGIALSRRVTFDLGYRYLATEEADFDSDEGILTSMKFRSHNALMGVRVTF